MKQISLGLNLSTKKIAAADFVNEKKGLTAVVSNLKPGTKVTFYVGGVTGNAKNVKPYETTVTADEDGNAIPMDDALNPFR